MNGSGWPTREVEIEATLELTEAQIEALQVAEDLGWFRVPKEADSSDLSRALKVGNSPATRRIRMAERGIMEAVVDALPDLCPLGCGYDLDGRELHEHLGDCPEGLSRPPEA